MSDERGMTLAEVVVAMSLLSAVAALFFPLLVSSTKAVRVMEAQTDEAGVVRAAVAAVGRELRSAVCVSEPAPAPEPAPVLRFTTQADNRLYEVTYRLTAGELRREVTGESERIVVEGITEEGGFQQLAGTRAAVVVDLHAETTAADRPGRQLKTLVAARNGWRTC